MFYQARRIVLVFIVCCLANQIGQADVKRYAAVPPEETLHISSETDTKNINIGETLSVNQEMDISLGVMENKEKTYEKVLAEADKTIEDTEELLDQYEDIQLQDTVKKYDKVLKENITLAGRSGYIEDKPHEKVLWYDLSHEELKLMARVIQAEAGGEPYEGQVAVANVIFNRVKAGWGDTVTEVLTQPGQFTKTRKEPSNSVLDAINEALYGRNAVPEGTLFFQNLDISKDFTVPKTKEYVTKVGRHTFYR